MDYTHLFKFYQLTTGRRLFALRQVREAAVVRGLTHLVVRIDTALAHDRATRQLDLAWSGARAHTVTDHDVSEIDRLLDSALVGLRDMAQAMTRGARSSDPVHDRVATLLSKIFPAGVVAVTSLPYVDQLGAAEAIVELLQGELAVVVDELGLHAHVARIISLVGEYRVAQESEPMRVTYSQVKTARVAGHAFLCEVVAIILGTFHRRDRTDHNEARIALLAPILAQHAAIRVYRQRRRAVVDIDPDTGEPERSRNAGDSAERDNAERDGDASASVSPAPEAAGPRVSATV